jgi:hypothetical protein
MVSRPRYVNAAALSLNGGRSGPGIGPVLNIALSAAKQVNSYIGGIKVLAKICQARADLAISESVM